MPDGLKVLNQSLGPLPVSFVIWIAFTALLAFVLYATPFKETITDAPILEMRNISKAFGGVQALRDVSFSCRKGKVHALLGENGAGKSTLIKILAGAYRADSGEIVFKGKSHAAFSAREAMATGISIIYQELNFVQFMTVAENIFLGREPRNRLGVIDTRRMTKESAELLDQLGVRLSPSAQIGDLTVANQQMVEIAKALSQNADLIVMDEPSAILAGHELHSLFATIRSLVEQGVTVIYISHRLNEIFEIADDVTVLKDGRVVSVQPISEVSRARLIQMMVGRPLEEIFPRATRSRGAPVLTATDVTTERLSSPASLTLYEGEILGLAGMVGAGRTEVALGAVRRGRAPHWQDPAQGCGDSAEQSERRGRSGAGARAGGPQDPGAVPRTVDTQQHYAFKPG